MVKATRRRDNEFTTSPDPPPVVMICPKCDVPLTYVRTLIAGVVPRERWDYYRCPTCGPFEYRVRTRRLRPTTASF